MKEKLYPKKDINPAAGIENEFSFPRNPGIPLRLDLIDSVSVNKSAVERRINTLKGRRTVKKEWQIAWMLKAISLIDLTTLSGDDTPGRVRRLCAKAKQPIRQDILEALKFNQPDFHVGAVCVYHQMIPTAVESLREANIPIATVSTGFPAGQSPLAQRIEEIKASVENGADEIDIVIYRPWVLTGQWEKLYNEVKAYRQACGKAHLKTILATGELGTLKNVYRASLTCMMAGADFIKTSTGKESINANLPVGLCMIRAIRQYFEETKYRVGFKPAGDIRTAKDALLWLMLMKEELGRPYLTSSLFRFGASSLLSDIERQIEFHQTGRYSASFRHPVT